MIADFVEHALRMAYVNRADLSSLPKNGWDEPGVYVLLTGDGSGKAYVGMTTQLRTRLQNHHSNPQLPWTRAMLVKRDTTAGFNTAEIGYLEGRVAAELGAVQGITVVQGKMSGDETLPSHMRISLDSFVKSILAALRLTGIDITRAEADDDTDQTDVVIPPSSGVGRRVLLSELLRAGLLQTDEELHLQQASVQAKGIVTAEGGIIVNGVEHGSPSSAARAALGTQSSNGWTTWHVGSLSGSTLDLLRTKLLAQEDELSAVNDSDSPGKAAHAGLTLSPVSTEAAFFEGR